MARFARAAVDGGAAGIRAEGEADIAAIRRVVSVPIIGIRKVVQADGRVLITPSVEAAAALVAAGADMIAVECTSRGHRYGALERVVAIRRDLQVPVLADIATLGEARAAEDAGADFVLSTMRGHTPDTSDVRVFGAAFIAELVGALRTPVIAEGLIATPEDARTALEAGAYAVVVGTAITRPSEITRRFVQALSS